MEKEETVWMVIVPFTSKENAEQVSKGILFATDIVRVKKSEYNKLHKRSII